MKRKKSNQTSPGLYEVNLASLVDVCLTLVIIFMVSYPFVMQSGIKISTPVAGDAKTGLQVSHFKAEIHIRDDETIELNGERVAMEVFADSLQSLLETSEQKLALISADGQVSHDRVVAVLDVARQSGAEKLSIVRRQ